MSEGTKPNQTKAQFTDNTDLWNNVVFVERVGTLQLYPGRGRAERVLRSADVGTEVVGCHSLDLQGRVDCLAPLILLKTQTHNIRIYIYIYIYIYIV